MKYMITLVMFLMAASAATLSQDNGYKIIVKKEVAATPVKKHSLASTGWSFSGLSFFESELLRMGEKPYDLSEMYIVKEAYERQAEEYANSHGDCSFSPGGQYYDLLNITKEFGLVP